MDDEFLLNFFTILTKLSQLKQWYLIPTILEIPQPPQHDPRCFTFAFSSVKLEALTGVQDSNPTSELFSGMLKNANK